MGGALHMPLGVRDLGISMIFLWIDGLRDL